MNIIQTRGAVLALSAKALSASFLLSVPLASGVDDGGARVLADASLLQEAGLSFFEADRETGVALARLTPAERERLSAAAHARGRCGGYEALPESLAPLSAEALFAPLRTQSRLNARWENAAGPRLTLQKDPAVERAVAQVAADNLRTTVQKLSAYPTRYNKGSAPNAHVDDFAAGLRVLASSAAFPIQVDLIAHSSTPQKSVRARIEGSERPAEIVVLGGHLDSINQSWFGGGSKPAPGADDNASGSAAVLEAFRVLSSQPEPPKRSIEFFWYAGEESGLLGSSEIAQAYKAKGADVVGVLQLDMVLFPGSGKLTIASMTDFTNAWLRDYFAELNRLYVGANVVESRCGYGCSDHASWHRQGYPALMPFEARMNDSNEDIHTEGDVIGAKSDFEHAAAFAKLATAYAFELSRSSARPPRAP